MILGKILHFVQDDISFLVFVLLREKVTEEAY